MSLLNSSTLYNSVCIEWGSISSHSLHVLDVVISQTFVLYFHTTGYWLNLLSTWREIMKLLESRRNGKMNFSIMCKKCSPSTTSLVGICSSSHGNRETLPVSNTLDKWLVSAIKFCLVASHCSCSVLSFISSHYLYSMWYLVNFQFSSIYGNYSLTLFRWW